MGLLTNLRSRWENTNVATEFIAARDEAVEVDEIRDEPWFRWFADRDYVAPRQGTRYNDLHNLSMLARIVDTGSTAEAAKSLGVGHHYVQIRIGQLRHAGLAVSTTANYSGVVKVSRFGALMMQAVAFTEPDVVTRNGSASKDEWLVHLAAQFRTKPVAEVAKMLDRSVAQTYRYRRAAINRGFLEVAQ